MVTFNFFPWWFWTLPFLCVAGIGAGIFHIKCVNNNTLSPDESVSALTSFIHDSLLVFLKKQLIFIGITIAGITAGSIALQLLHLHHMMLSVLIVWGVVWSTIMGVSTVLWISKMSGLWVQLAITFPEKWNAQTHRIGWAMTLIPMGILTLDLWTWITALYESVHHNWVQIGTHLMESAGIAGQWSSAAMTNATMTTIVDREISLILLAYCFGSLIQTFLIGITSRTMLTSVHRANAHILFSYPDIRSHDLRNPVSMATLVSEINFQTWGKLSQMTNVFLMVVLSGMAIGVSAFREDGVSFGSHLMILPLLLIGVGLLGGIVASMIPRPTLLRQIGATSLVMSVFTGIATVMGSLSLHYAAIILGGAIVASALAVLQSRKSDSPDIVTGRLEKFTLILCAVVVWMAFNFLAGLGHTHILLGINGMAIGAISLLAVGLPLFAMAHRSSLKNLTQTMAITLGVENDMPEQRKKKEGIDGLHPTVLAAVSAWVWFFIFLDSTPHWVAKIHNPVVIDRFATALNNLTHIPLTGNNQTYLIDHLSFTEIDLILGISPTNPFFGFGLIAAIIVGLAIGIVWMRAIRRITQRLVINSQTQLEEVPDIQLGLTLPSYRDALHLVTRTSFWTSITIWAGLVVGTLVLGGVMGFGGLSGVLLGSIIVSMMIGIAQATDVKDDLRDEFGLATIMMTTATQTLLLFSILFGGALLHFGGGL